MNTATEDFYKSIDGPLTPEQAAQALALAETGDTGAQPENGGAPTTTTEAGNQPPATESTNDKAAADAGNQAQGTVPLNADELTRENAVILARDGKHTIPFEKLEEARQGAQHWKTQFETLQAQAEASQQQLAQLQAQAQERADSGQAPTRADNLAAAAQDAVEKGVDISLFGDFSEEAMAKGIAQLVRQEVQAGLKDGLKPLHEQQQQTAVDKHYAAIYGAHPNADSIAQSAEFAEWVNSHPSTARAAMWQLLDPQKGGTAAEIVEVFDAFTKANEKPSTTTPTPDPKAAAAAAVQAAKQSVPTSLSSIPGGRADGLSQSERMSGLSANELSAAFEGKTAEQIEAILNRRS